MIAISDKSSWCIGSNEIFKLITVAVPQTSFSYVVSLYCNAATARYVLITWPIPGSTKFVIYCILSQSVPISSTLYTTTVSVLTCMPHGC